MTTLRSYLPAAVLVAGWVLLVATKEQRRMALAEPLQRGLPVEIPGFTARVQKLSADERRAAGMSDYVMRHYVRNSAVAFTVYVGYYEYQTQGRSIHSPRNCLPGAGWEVREPGTRQIAAGGTDHRVNRYLLANGTAEALVYYWYQGRGRVAWDEYAVKWELFRDATVHRRTEEALVRLILPLDAGAGEPQVARADSLARVVAARLMEDVSRALPPGPRPARATIQGSSRSRTSLRPSRRTLATHIQLGTHG